MNFLAIALSEMGLGYLSISLILGLIIFFFISFFLTSKNLDTKGLLRVLYSKPIRTNDGRVEYRQHD